MKEILVYGSKDFGIIVKDIVIACGRVFLGYIDDYYVGEGVIGNWEYVLKTFAPENYEVVIAIGYSNLQKRREVFSKVFSSEFQVATLIHPNSFVAPTAIVGKGSIIMTGAIVDAHARLGQCVVAWPGVIVNHDSVIESNVFLSPGSIVCGFSRVGNDVFIGAGAVIVDKVQVKSGDFIRAGSVYY